MEFGLAQADFGMYLLELCGGEKTFKNKYKLNEHIKLRHLGLTFDCTECGKSLSSKKKLKIHTDSIHKGITYPCELCDRKFSSWNTRYTHVKNVHHKERKFPCSQCDKRFNSKKYLDKHLKTHLEKISCRNCDKTYKLETSVKFGHPETTDFLCGFCQKEVDEKDCLKVEIQS